MLRDGDSGLEVFMQRRHGRSGFMAGATVFPGGKVDPTDAAANTYGRTARECADLLGSADVDEARAFFVAAIRELHEEAGVLLACDDRGQLPTAELAGRLADELENLRDGHRVDAGRHLALLVDAGLALSLDRLVPFAHWITPKIEPRRFDTRFFAALCPDDQVAGLDGNEMTHALWCRPAAALQAHHGGEEIVLPPPTLHTLERLQALGDTADQVLTALARAPAAPRIEPLFVPDSDEGPIIVMPDDPLHPEYEATVPADKRHAERANRFILRDGRFSRRHGADAI